jgi:sialate O-acetylesterase
MRFTQSSSTTRYTIAGMLAWALAAVPNVCQAKIELPNVFGDHMVVQREQENPIWGKADANAEVTIVVGDRKVSCNADANGDWKAKLPVLAVGGPYTIKITSGSDSVSINDVLSGEVWICSGQSNMQWSVASSENFELEKLAANYPKIRMINFPQIGTQSPIWSHKDRHWMVCNADTVGGFSAVGYFFGRQLYQTLDVPIGLINNAWGGSAAEAWIDQKTLNEDSRFAGLTERWKKDVAEYDALKAKSELNDDEKKRLADLEKNMTGNFRPGNIYNGVLASHLGYGIRGAIWYQGESNAGRAYQYRDLFPLMISHWRERWGQDFPFYWVQLADFQKENSEPVDSAWAELREAQTMTLDKLKNTGEAVIIDIGEGKDIHPRNKVDVGRRLARLALKNEYGKKIAADSPRYESMKVDGNSIVLSFKHVESGWRPFDVNYPIGFTIAGEDHKFHNAKAEIVDGNKIRVSADGITAPVAVRYAWADNPQVNLYDKNDLPLTPFRTDDWKGVTADNQ